MTSKIKEQCYVYVTDKVSMLVTMMTPLKCGQPPLECGSNEDSSRSSVDETNNNNGDVELTSLNWLHNLNIIPSLLPTPPSSPTPSQTVQLPTPQAPVRVKHGEYKNKNIHDHLLLEP
jgi:hypothetical protein